MGPIEEKLWKKWESEIRKRIKALPSGKEFEIKELFKAEWDTEIVKGERNAFGTMFQKVLKSPDKFGSFKEIEALGVKEDGDNHERYRRL
ncbi:DUF1413 domain-containing protein [Rubrimonas sp.]|uniref:DUF1413 domain-containing protein n=1 Tax=Rubrimonas sp. TaxID=2036015 RepID=UPI002FDCE645